MNIDITKTIEKYLEYFPSEKSQLKQLKDFIEKAKEKRQSIYSPTNTIGHITASAYIYSKKDRRLLLLEHKKLNKLLQPGGHVEDCDENLLETARREVYEETGLKNLKVLGFDIDNKIPIDINTHYIPENTKNNMPCHYHHDFRYLFIINSIKDITIDENESNGYQWTELSRLCNNEIFSNPIKKINMLMSNELKEKFFYSEIIKKFNIDLEDYECIIITHIVTGSEEFLRELNSVCNIKAIIPKPNSINYDVLNNIKEKYNILHLKREEIESSVELTKLIKECSKKLIIFDVGGYFSNIVKIPEIASQIKCIIEDTENGYQKYISKYNQKIIDIISVARSELKENEDYLVGQSVLFSADAILRNMGKLISYMNCGIIGFGKIGSSIANHLLQRGIKANVYDKDEVRLMKSYNRGFLVATKDKIIEKSEVLFLATGNHCLNINDFRKLKNGSIVFSVTSSDDEIDDSYLESEYNIIQIDDNIYKYENNYNFFYLIKKGNAVNFTHNAIMGDFISIVKAEMLVAAYQETQDNNLFDKSKKIWETTYDTKQKISRIWLDTFLS